MSGKQELEKLVNTYAKARKEAETLVNKAAEENRQARQEQTERQNRPT